MYSSMYVGNQDAFMVNEKFCKNLISTLFQTKQKKGQQTNDINRYLFPYQMRFWGAEKSQS